MNINLREPSTKRGIVMLITGATILYQTFWGSGQIDIDSTLARVDWWLGVGLTLVGMLGLLPDRDSSKRTRETDEQLPKDLPALPPIELTGKATVPGEEAPSQDVHNDNSGNGYKPRNTDAWMHDPVPSEARFKHGIDPNKGSVGWNDDH